MGSAVKQVIIIRRDLKMRRGKEIAQGSHASMAFLTNQIRMLLKNGAMQHGETKVSSAGADENSDQGLVLTESMIQWILSGSAKVCLQVRSEQELLDLSDKAASLGVPAHLIRDSGRTEFGGVPTLTALALGPDKSDTIDQVSGHLSLY